MRGGDKSSPQSPVKSPKDTNISKEFGFLVQLFGIPEKVKQEGEQVMAKVQNSPVPATGAKPPYTFRAGWALLLLAVNFLVAAYYFHIIE
jgi:photosystem I protein